MRAEAIVDQTQRWLVPLLQHEELLGVPYPFKESFNYQVYAVGKRQEMQLDRFARRRAYDLVICGNHD